MPKVSSKIDKQKLKNLKQKLAIVNFLVFDTKNDLEQVNKIISDTIEMNRSDLNYMIPKLEIIRDNTIIPFLEQSLEKSEEIQMEILELEQKTPKD